MSYSFSVQAPSKSEALVKVADELTKVVTNQPVHLADQQVAQGAAASFVDLLVTDDAQDVAISVHGSIWTTDAGVQQVSIGVNAALAKRKS